MKVLLLLLVCQVQVFGNMGDLIRSQAEEARTIEEVNRQRMQVQKKLQDAEGLDEKKRLAADLKRIRIHLQSLQEQARNKGTATKQSAYQKAEAMFEAIKASGRLRQDTNAHLEMRTWTSSDGKHHVEAVFVEMRNNEVTMVKKDGAEIAVVPLSKFHRKDRKIIQQKQSFVDEQQVSVEERIEKRQRTRVRAGLKRSYNRRGRTGVENFANWWRSNF